MSRRRRNKDAPISLFPFLSILACVIGVLTLMITALALGQLDPGQVLAADKQVHAQRDLDLRYVQAREQSDRDTEEIERLKELIVEAQTVQGQLESARAEVQKLESERSKQMFTSADDQKNNAQLLSDANRLRMRVTDMEPELHLLLEQIDRLRQEVANLKKKPEQAVVTIQPSGSGTDLMPTFVECAAGEIVIYDGDEPIHVRRADVAKSDPYLKTLDDVAKNDRRIVIFLLREDGLGTYFVARGIARQRYAINGKLPVVGHGRIDLSLFKNLVKQK